VPGFGTLGGPRGGDLVEPRGQGLAESYVRASVGMGEVGALEASAHLRRQSPARVVVNEFGFEPGQVLEGLRVSEVALFEPGLLRFGEFPEQVARQCLVGVSHRSKRAARSLFQDLPRSLAPLRLRREVKFHAGGAGALRKL
jgi:hypothetical protein